MISTTGLKDGRSLIHTALESLHQLADTTVRAEVQFGPMRVQPMQHLQ